MRSLTVVTILALLIGYTACDSSAEQQDSGVASDAAGKPSAPTALGRCVRVWEAQTMAQTCLEYTGAAWQQRIAAARSACLPEGTWSDGVGCPDTGHQGYCQIDRNGPEEAREYAYNLDGSLLDLAKTDCVNASHEWHDN